MNEQGVIISYSKSEADKIWKNRLVTQLKVLEISVKLL